MKKSRKRLSYKEVLKIITLTYLNECDVSWEGNYILFKITTALEKTYA